MSGESRMAYWVGWMLLRPLFTLFFRLKFIGRRFLPSGPHLLCSTHRSHLDSLAIGLAYPPSRTVHFMAKKELFAVPFVGRVISWWGAFPVRRGKGDRDAIQLAVKLLEKGEVVGIFPEGTRQKGKEVKPLKTGAVRIALKAKVPIVPVYIQGTEEAFPKGAKLPRPGKVTLFFGEPIDLSPYYDKEWTAEFLHELSEKVRKALQALKP